MRRLHGLGGCESSMMSNYADLNSRFLDECRRRKKRPADLTFEEATEIAIYVRTLWEKVRDFSKQQVSAGITSIVKVSLQVYQERSGPNGCEGCPRFKRLNGKPFCLQCQCGGTDLESKWWNPFESCPMNPPVWNPHV